MHILPDHLDVVIGVDTHKHTHTAAILNPTGKVLEVLTVPANPAGFAQLIAAVDRHSTPTGRVWGIEGCGSWGRPLLRWLQPQGETIEEVERPGRPRRRHGIKDDATDAIRAARDVLNRLTAQHPRNPGIRDALNAARLARASAVQAATDAERQLDALALTAPAPLHELLGQLRTHQLVTACTRLDPTQFPDPIHQSYATTMVTLAQRITTLRAEATAHHKVITHHVRQWRPDLLDHCGIGPIVAAVILNSWSHPGRIHSAAAFAMLAGTAPIPASSGNTTRHRLNRSGDRTLNQAINTIVLSRIRHHADTQAYIQRRRTEGKTDRDIRRCLKNYIAKELYRILEQPLDRT